MLRTPKAYQRCMTSDILPSCDLDKSDSFESQLTSEGLDALLAPKNFPVLAPLQNRYLPLKDFKSIKNNRTRIIDWYLQIFSTYNLGWQCFWMTIQLLDSLIAEFKYVTQTNIHLVGIVCSFMVAKYLGKPMTLKNVIAGLGHHKFSEGEVVMEEQRIVMLTFSRSNFQRNNIYSYLMERYCDLPVDVLTQAMKMMTVGMMRPDIVFQELPVRTYIEFVDFVITEIGHNRRVFILEEVYKYLMEKFGSSNLQLGDKMSFI